MKKMNILVRCHNNGNVRSLNGFPSVLNERLVKKANEESVLFSSNVKNQDEIGMMDLVPRKGAKPSSPSGNFSEGIGIIRYLQAKQLFITGATGFLAKGDNFFFLISSSPLNLHFLL